MNEEKVIAMIPARVGSERLKHKNLRMLGGKPVIAYVIDSAKEADVFEHIVVNSDQSVFGKIAERHGVEFFLRSQELGTSETKSDDVIADFMDHHKGDILVWVNPIAPLQPASEIRAVVEYFIDQGFDSLITVKDEQVHSLYQGKPVNFSVEGLFAKTQDLTPIQPFVYSLMMWRYRTFLNHYHENGYALLSGRVGYYSVHKDSTIILKYEDDLRMAEAVLRSREARDEEPEYDPVVTELTDRGDF